MFKIHDLHCEGTDRNCNRFTVPVFKSISLAVITVADKVPAGCAEPLPADGAGARLRIQSAYGVDVGARIGTGGIFITICQADVQEVFAFGDFSGKVYAGGPPFGDADLIPGHKIAADFHLGRFNIRADFKNINVISLAVIDCLAKPDRHSAAAAEVEVAGRLSRIARIRQAEDKFGILIVLVLRP